jgi:DNA-binding MarR family transcriptional regulator
MNIGRIVLSGERLFSRVPLGMLAELPKAARRVYEALHYLRRKGREIDVSVGELCELTQVKRRCVTKGLEQLEDLGIILRDKCMAFGRRIITFLVRFAGESAREARKAKSRATGQQNAPAKEQADQLPMKTSAEMANLLLGELWTRGWGLKLQGDGSLIPIKLRDDAASVPEDLRRKIKGQYRDDIAAQVKASGGFFPSRE